MPENKHTEPTKGDRRQFISNTLKIALLGTIISPMELACNNENKVETSLQKKTSNRGKKRRRKKWSNESLVLNSKTKVVHFPTKKMYHYYDEIKPKNLKTLSIAAWATQLKEPMRLNREQSGNIIEMLTLRGLPKELTDASLNVAINNLSLAFGKKYVTENKMNFRLHELMLQLIALNTLIPADQKWKTFSTKVVKPPQLRKRQKWMETDKSFNARVKYILDRRDEYKTRLSKRAARYYA